MKSGTSKPLGASDKRLLFRRCIGILVKAFVIAKVTKSRKNISMLENSVPEKKDKEKKRKVKRRERAKLDRIPGRSFKPLGTLFSCVFQVEI